MPPARTVPINPAAPYTPAIQSTAPTTGAVLAYWACQIFGWSTNGLFQVLNIGGNVPGPLDRLLVEVALLNLLAIASTHLLRSFMKRRQWSTLDAKVLLPRLLIASVALSLPLSILMHFMAVAPMWKSVVLHLERLPASLHWMFDMDPLLLRTLNWTAILFVWMVLYFCITALRDRRLVALQQSELTRALHLAELRLLKSQLNPHFLFNSLNSVRALVADDPAGAQRAVTQLARTLRYTLNAYQEELVSLERELEIVADYLELESLRLGDRLTIERNIAPEAATTRIPAMLLQTIVENAVKHGIAELPRGGVLSITATLQDDALTVEVRNPRPGTQTYATEGIGLRNAAERLRLLFGTAAQLQLDLSQPHFALTRIRIPQHA
jgi:sensor histidine kinase YesM